MTAATEIGNKPAPNAHLVSVPGSRLRLATPCLVLDRARLDANVAAAQAFANANAIALRPHGKSHKCPDIAARQIASGAAGICAATIGEAEAFAAGGVADILVTSALTQPGKMARAAALAASGCRLGLVADDPGMVDALGAAAARAGTKLAVLVDVDLGRKRNGVTSPEQARAVAARIAANSHLALGGVQAYASHISHVPAYADRLAASREAAARIDAICAALEADGHQIATVTGGSTGTVFLDPSLGCYTELQAGSYVFSDVEYHAIDLDGARSAGRSFAPSLFVRVTVIGRNVAGRVTCDGGNKHFSAKGTLPGLVAPPAVGATYQPDSDEHGFIILPDSAMQPALGANFELIVPHCDPTVNLYDHLHVVDGDTLTDIWPITGRGAY